jgi:subtilisin-like proprotein convertase family protein
MLRSVFLFLTLALSGPLFAQTFNGAGGDIPDDGNAVEFSIEVSGLPAATDTSLFGLESVCFNITHTWIADISIALISPDGQVIQLLNSLGGDTDFYDNTCLSNNADVSVYQAPPPFTGVFRPLGEMGVFNKGQNPNGIWKLRILDTYAFADAGALSDWRITFGSNPCKPFPFESSDLPIIRINTLGNIIVNDPKVDAELEYIDNGPGQRNYADQPDVAFRVLIGIELHGNSSQGFPKKNYRIESRDSTGEDLDIQFPGLAATSDFILHASFSDKTHLRNSTTYELFRQMGHYATRTRFCELMLDGAYQGIYVITERIKRGDDLVDIARLTPQDDSGDDLTGGYIVRIDWNSTPGWNSQYQQPNSANYTYFQHFYPQWDRLIPQQTDYIRSYVDSFETSLASPDFQNMQTGWRRYAHETSFLDYLLINELSKNVDGYRLSTYFHKDKNNRTVNGLQMGPPWDHDLAWYNADYCESGNTSGWAYNINYVCADAGVPFWWERLFQDSLFTRNLACRWQSLRQGPLHTDRIFSLIDSLAGTLEEAQARNFKIWPILGVYVWPNPGFLPDTYQGEVDKMKTWILSRINWLDFTFQQMEPQLDASYEATPQDAFNWSFSAVVQGPQYSYFWDFGDGQTGSGASVLHQFASTGTYKVKLYLSTQYGCEVFTQQILHIVNTGTAAPEGYGTAQVYPNPVGDTYRVDLPTGINGPVVLEWLDGSGRVCHREQAHTPVQANSPEVPAGVYQLRVLHAQGIWQLKIIR